MTYTHNLNGVCFDTDHNPNGTQPTTKRSLTLSFGLPGLNEIIRDAKIPTKQQGKKAIPGMVYASKKKKYTKKVENELIAQHCIPETPMISISINCIWTESGRARDPDNIRVGIKYILDAMVNTGVLKDDSMKYVKFIGDTFQKGDKRMVQINWSE